VGVVERVRPGKDSVKHASSVIEGGLRLGPTTNVVRKGGGVKEGARGGKDSGKHASSAIEGGSRLRPTTNVVGKGGGVEEGGRPGAAVYRFRKAGIQQD